MYLHEEILLLALKDDSGKIDWKAGNFLTVMAGAIIAELILEQRLRLSKDGRELITLVDGTAHDNEVLAEALQIIAADSKTRDIEHWIAQLADLDDLKEKTAVGLCDQGILKAEEKKFLLIFNTLSFPEDNPVPEDQIIERLREAIFGSGEVDARTTVLLSLTHASDMLSIPIPRADLKKREKRIEEIIKGEAIGEATADVIEATEAAIAMVAVMPAVTIATSGSSGCGPH